MANLPSNAALFKIHLGAGTQITYKPLAIDSSAAFVSEFINFKPPFVTPYVAMLEVIEETVAF
jgi:hypothetical protein